MRKEHHSFAPNPLTSVSWDIYRPCKHHISTTVAKVAYTYFSLLICQPTLSTIAIHFKRALLNDVNELIFYVKISS